MENPWKTHGTKPTALVIVKLNVVGSRFDVKNLSVYPMSTVG